MRREALNGCISQIFGHMRDTPVHSPHASSPRPPTRVNRWAGPGGTFSTTSRTYSFRPPRYTPPLPIPETVARKKAAGPRVLGPAASDDAAGVPLAPDLAGYRAPRGAEGKKRGAPADPGPSARKAAKGAHKVPQRLVAPSQDIRAMFAAISARLPRPAGATGPQGGAHSPSPGPVTSPPGLCPDPGGGSGRSPGAGAQCPRPPATFHPRTSPPGRPQGEAPQTSRPGRGWRPPWEGGAPAPATTALRDM